MGALPENTWGVLHVYAPGASGLTRVRREVAEAFEARGLKKVRWRSVERLIEEHLGTGGIEEPHLNREEQLTEDEVLVLPESADGWIAVKSRRLECVLPGRHPLARILSSKWAVLSITSAERQYAEYTLYRDGKAVQMTLVGTAPEVSDVSESLPPLDLAWFRDKGALGAPAELEAALSEPEELSRLAGPDALGYRDSFDAAPLEDYPPASFLVFRRPTERAGKPKSKRNRPSGMYDQAMRLWDAGKEDAALAKAEAILALTPDSEWDAAELTRMQGHARELLAGWRAKRAEAEKRARIADDAEGWEPVEIYNTALEMAQRDDANEATLHRALELLRLASQKGFFPARHLADQLAKSLERR